MLTLLCARRKTAGRRRLVCVSNRLDLKSLWLRVRRREFYRNKAHFTGEGCWCGAGIAHIDGLSAVGVILGMRKRVVDVAGCMATNATTSLDHEPSGFTEVRITTFWEDGGCRRRRSAEKGVPRDAEDMLASLKTEMAPPICADFA